VAIPVSLCSSEDHGHHLQKEKAIIAKKFSLCPMANSVNGVSKSEEDIPPFDVKMEAGV